MWPFKKKEDKKKNESSENKEKVSFSLSKNISVESDKTKDTPAGSSNNSNVSYYEFPEGSTQPVNITGMIDQNTGKVVLNKSMETYGKQFLQQLTNKRDVLNECDQAWSFSYGCYHVHHQIDRTLTCVKEWQEFLRTINGIDGVQINLTMAKGVPFSILDIYVKDDFVVPFVDELMTKVRTKEIEELIDRLGDGDTFGGMFGFGGGGGFDDLD